MRDLLKASITLSRNANTFSIGMGLSHVPAREEIFLLISGVLLEHLQVKMVVGGVRAGGLGDLTSGSEEETRLLFDTIYFIFDSVKNFVCLFCAFINRLRSSVAGFQDSLGILIHFRFLDDRALSLH